MEAEFCLSYTTDPTDHLTQHVPIRECDWIGENDGTLPGVCCRDCIYNTRQLVALAD